jgi:hypothetical protein
MIAMGQRPDKRARAKRHLGGGFAGAQRLCHHPAPDHFHCGRFVRVSPVNRRWRARHERSRPGGAVYSCSPQNPSAMGT